jgi:hypothetical protein
MFHTRDCGAAGEPARGPQTQFHTGPWFATKGPPEQLSLVMTRGHDQIWLRWRFGVLTDLGDGHSAEYDITGTLRIRHRANILPRPTPTPETRPRARSCWKDPIALGRQRAEAPGGRHTHPWPPVGNPTNRRCHRSRQNKCRLTQN